MEARGLFTQELIGICRLFGVFERDAICCGTVSVPQCVVLQELLRSPADVSTLAKALGVTNSAMTRLLDGLEKRDYVRRERSTQDRRRVELTLTAEGHVEAERLRGLTERAVGAVLARIPEHRHEQVLESVRLIHGALRESRSAFDCC